MDARGPRIVTLLCFMTTTALSWAEGDRMVVIVNKDNQQVIDLARVRSIYTGATRAWPNGGPVDALDLSQGGAEREAFCQQWLGRSSAALQAIWTQNIFTGKGLSPRVAVNDAEMKRAVAEHRTAIGYIHEDSADDTIRVVQP